MTPLISGYYIVLCVLGITGLSIYLTYRRNRAQAPYDQVRDLSLIRARRGFNAMLQYSAPFLFVLVPYELMGGDKLWIHALGTIFLLGRVSHVASALFLTPKSLARAVGALVSHACTLLLCVRILAILF